MFRKISLLVPVLIAVFVNIHQAFAIDADYEIVVQFDEGIVQMPLGQSIANINEVSFSNPEIADTIVAYTGTTISQPFPDFDYSDSIMVSPHFPNMTTLRTPFHRIYHVGLSNPELRDSLMIALSSFPEIRFMSRNATVEVVTNFPDDPLLLEGGQWALYDTTSNRPPADIDAPEAWDRTTGDGSNHYIGVIDYGVNLDHQDLQGRIEGDTPWAGSTHGTEVAGIIGAVTDNGYGMAGINWSAPMYSHDIQYDNITQICHLIEGLLENPSYYVLNCSWGSDPYNGGDPLFGSFLLDRTFSKSAKLGYTVVAGRGNFRNNEPFYPATLGPHVINVGAYDHYNEKSDFSSYGGFLDIVAPGGKEDYFPGEEEYELIQSTTRSPDWFGHNWGTSLATAHVTGAISLLQSCFDEIKPYDYYEGVLKAGAIDIHFSGYDEKTGWGKLNLNNSLKILEEDGVSFYDSLVSFSSPYRFDSTEYPPLSVWFEDVDAPREINFLGRVVVYEVRQDVTFAYDLPPGAMPFNEIPFVFGRSTATTGWLNQDEVGPMGYPRPFVFFAVPYCDIVPGTLTQYGVTLKTYVVGKWHNTPPQWPPYDEFYRYFPCAPEDVEFCYAVVGDNQYPAQPINLSVVTTGPPDYHIRLDWANNEESDLAGYNIYRHAVNFEPDWIQIGQTAADTNFFIDTTYCTPHPGHLGSVSEGRYRISAIDIHSNESPFTPYEMILIVEPESPGGMEGRYSDLDDIIPAVTRLRPNYPNPFNNSTNIKFELANPSNVDIAIYNVTGQLVESLCSDYYDAGRHNVTWKAGDASSGVYFVKFSADNITATRKMNLIR